MIFRQSKRTDGATQKTTLKQRLCISGTLALLGSFSLLSSMLLTAPSTQAVEQAIVAKNSTVMATPENTKSNYRAKTLESCNKFSADLDKQTACLTGAMGEDLLQYYPLSSVSCEYINDFKTKKLTDACKEGAKAGKSTYRAFYSGVDKAYEQAVKNACAQYKNSDTEWQWCVYGGMGEASKEGFPVHPTTCTNSPTLARQDANQSACIAGSEAGNGILLSYTETGTLTNIDGSTIAGSTDAATGGGGNGQAGAGGATNGGYENGFGSGENPGERLPTSPDDIKQEANNQNPSKPANDFKENLGADKNGAGTAQLQKQPSSAPGLPLAQSGTSQYVDGGGGTQNLEFFHPDDKKRPLIIFVPGGGWREDGGTFQRDFQIRAGKQGFASIRANYRKAANGLYATYNDVNNLLKSVRENANTYNIDPQRIVMWGDSAGGSLTARTAASGTSGLSTAVTWSGPMNAIRDLFTISPESFLIGIDHSTCIDTEWTNQLRPLQEIWRGYEFLAHDPARILSMPLDQQLEVVRRLERSMGPIMIARDGIHKMLDGWEIDVPRARELIVSTRDSLYRIETVVAEMDPSKPISTKPDLLANSSLGTAGSTLHELLPRLAKHAELSSEVQQQVVILTEVDRALQNGFDSPERLAQAISSLAGNQDIRTYLNLQNAGPVNNQQVISLMERVAAGGMSQQDIINAGTPIVRAVLAQSADEFARLTQVKDANGNTILLNNIGTTVQQTGKGKAAAGTKYSQEDALALAVTNLTDAEIAELAKTSPIPKEVAAQLGLSEDEQARITNLTQGFDQSSRVIMRNMSLLLDDFEGTSSKQILPIRKINECIDNFKQLSPSLFAHPQTPPMFMANASHERLVPAQDAYEMRDKLQSFGTRAEVLILPGDIHMGYDQRAEEPSFRFIRDITKPEPVRHEPAAATTVPGPRRSSS